MIITIIIYLGFVKYVNFFFVLVFVKIIIISILVKIIILLCEVYYGFIFCFRIIVGFL